ncbi:MAG: TlpA family protein disulfide reductase, partial [Deltaproteobacteria bacterium]|nr:TlpA family protein disulfide reductase [Deltaproteobacteria bacterium]
MSTEPRPPFVLHVLWAPRQTFTAVMAARRGYGIVFALLAIEFVLIEPFDITTHVMRLTFAPVASLMGLWSAYLHYALPAGVAVFAAGVALYYALRLGRRTRLDLWTAASVIAYAWLPHLLLVAAGTIVAGLGFAHPVLPQYPFDAHALDPAGLVLKALIAYGPSAALLVLGARVAWRGGVEPSLPASRRARAGTAAIGLFLATALGFTVQRVVLRWHEARPPMPGDTLPAFALPQLDGALFDSRSLAGSVALIDFWATWCPPCVASMPHVEALYQEYTPRGFK